MNSSKYISDLLYRYQCVVMPNFGAFLTEVTSSEFHDGLNLFYPPKKKLSFNAQIQKNDGLLANHIAKETKCTYEEALVFLKEESEKWTQCLQNNEAVLLPKIGTLLPNESGIWLFEPNKEINYLSSSFGLGVVVAKQLQTKEEDWEVLSESNSKMIYFEEVSSKNTIKQLWGIAAAVAISGVAIGAFWYQKWMPQQEIALLAEVATTLDKNIQQATFVIENPFKNEVKSASKPFHVIAGSFRSKENALKSKDKLVKEGYNAVVLPERKDGIFTVAFGSFAAYPEAQNLLSEIQKKNPDAWLLVQEIKE